MLPSDTASGDILMSTPTGALTFAMASNYNRVPKSGVVAVTNNGVVELVSKQSFQDTFINDKYSNLSLLRMRSLVQI